MNIKHLLAAAMLALLGIPATSIAQGYQVQPMLATIEPSGAKSQLTMSIKNSGAVPITLEMTPFRATVDEAGTPTRVDDEKDVLVYPAQAIVEPGKEQTVQVRYIGDPALTVARMYGVRVSQLPVSAPGALAGATAGGAAADVKMSFNFLSHIIVSPSTAQSQVTVEDAGRAPNGDLMLRIANTGAGVAILKASDITLTDAGGKAVKLDSDQLKIGDFSAFMPGQTRRATVEKKNLAGLVGTIKPTLAVQ